MRLYNRTSTRIRATNWLGPSIQQGALMSAPSRRPEIRRRRTRAEKVQKLRKRLAAASGADKDRLTAKLHRYEQVSPGNPLIKSA
jgi:hypothetical protein